MLGNPSVIKPVFIWQQAGPCVLVLAVKEWMKAMSSTNAPRCGRRSDTHFPLSPHCRNDMGLFIKLPLAAVKETNFSSPGMGSPLRF
jgi:hypothetical protein